MKRIGSVAVVVAAAVVIMLTGQVFAAEKHVSGAIVPGGFVSGSWQHEGTVEAGILTKGEDISRAKLGGNEGFTLKEYSGIVYRAGVDTN